MYILKTQILIDAEYEDTIYIGRFASMNERSAWVSEFWKALGALNQELNLAPCTIWGKIVFPEERDGLWGPTRTRNVEDAIAEFKRRWRYTKRLART